MRWKTKELSQIIATCVTTTQAGNMTKKKVMQLAYHVKHNPFCLFAREAFFS